MSPEDSVVSRVTSMTIAPSDLSHVLLVRGGLLSLVPKVSHLTTIPESSSVKMKISSIQPPPEISPCVVCASSYIWTTLQCATDMPALTHHEPIVRTKRRPGPCYHVGHSPTTPGSREPAKNPQQSYAATTSTWPTSPCYTLLTRANVARL
jgi:hypothetical protein